MYVYLCKLYAHNYTCMTDYMHCVYTRSSAANDLTVYMKTFVLLKFCVINIVMLFHNIRGVIFSRIQFHMVYVYAYGGLWL